MQSEQENLVIIDGKSVFYRGYYAMGNLSLPDGTPTGGVYGFAMMLIEIIEKLRPEYIAVAWDKPKTNIRSRRAIYPDYKANRKPAPDDFYAQIPYLMELINAFHIPLYEFDDYEADDIIGTLARKAAREGIKAQIISGDLDMLQIIEDNVEVYHLKRGFSDVQIFNIAELEAKYQLKRTQFLDLKSLKGDGSDNIPGVPGIGEKGAIKLLTEYQTLENLYAHIDEIPGTVGKKLREGRELAFISKQLAEIRFDAPLVFDQNATRLADMDPQNVVEALKHLQFNSLIRRFAKLYPVDTAALATPKTTPKPTSQPIVPTASNYELTADTSFTVELPANLYLSHHVKDDLHAAPELADELLVGRPCWDLGQANFVINPLAKTTEQPSFLDSLSLESSYIEQRQQLHTAPRLERVLDELDMPLIPVLYKMEQAGLQIDPLAFKALEAEFNLELSQLEQDIYQSAGCEFNINSPAQLSDILFETLALPTKGIKKTQKAYSTGKSELEKLRNLHPIIAKIERYREINKLLTTYIQPLPQLADANQRIHTTFTQDVTATGRLSSINPNLQNIPTRSKDGKRIRDCFIAAPGHVLVSADYAQFELRLAAVLANDQALIQDFNSGIDIHSKTASDVYGIPLEQVDKNQRRSAKVINFGILYGMSPKGLADATDMSVSEAKGFIDQYFQLRAPIRKYLDTILETARQTGYVETYYGRRKPTPDLGARNYLVRAAAERAAANMPIQGTEADLMKKAMLAVDRQLPDGARLVLQIHDSLMVECLESQRAEVEQILRQTMEQVEPNLPIKLAVDVTSGHNWGEL